MTMLEVGVVFAKFDSFSSSCAMVAADPHPVGGGVPALALGGLARGGTLQCSVDYYAG